jgi:mRNA-degrading endonuclease RelE of RelBE toxin-antitoxin system
MPKSINHHYSLMISRAAASALAEKLPEKIAFAVFEFISGPLLDNPRVVGKPLRAPLAPAFAARRGVYRVIYLIDDGAKTVTVTDVSHRSSAYRP